MPVERQTVDVADREHRHASNHLILRRRLTDKYADGKQHDKIERHISADTQDELLRMIQRPSGFERLGYEPDGERQHVKNGIANDAYAEKQQQGSSVRFQEKAEPAEKAVAVARHVLRRGKKNSPVLATGGHGD